MNTAAEYFGLFLTALRNDGDLDELSDAATARMIEGALSARLELGRYDSQAEGYAAETISLALHYMNEAGELATDNGSN